MNHYYIIIIIIIIIIKIIIIINSSSSSINEMLGSGGLHQLGSVSYPMAKVPMGQFSTFNL